MARFAFRDGRGLRASIGRGGRLPSQSGAPAADGPETADRFKECAVKSRPILFSAPMVLALLSGRKTQTRRIVKNVPSRDHYGRDIMDWGLSGIHQGDFGEMVGTDRWFLDVQTDVDDNSRREIRCPYGAPGDRLFVRETHALVPASAYRRSEEVQQTINPTDPYQAAIYAAGWDRSIPKWRPSIHMPRWASRLMLEITEVRVERLQDCSEADALAEGIYRVDPDAADLAAGCTADDVVFMAPGTRQGWGMTPEDRAREKWSPTAAGAYRYLWEHINGPGSWAANPWVWALSFRRVEA